MARKLTRQQQFELAQHLRRAPETKSSKALRHSIFDAPEEIAINRKQRRSKRVNLKLIRALDERGKPTISTELFFLSCLIGLIYFISKLCLSLLVNA